MHLVRSTLNIRWVRIKCDLFFGPRSAWRLAAYAGLTSYIFLDGQTGVDSERHQDEDQARDVDAFVTLKVLLHIFVHLASSGQTPLHFKILHSLTG
jgi:hypothetical protein